MNKSSSAKNNLELIFEYFVIVFPIALYVAMESLHNGIMYMIKSPEWAIASIFLVFQSTFIFYKNVTNSGKKVKHHFLGILILLFLFVTVVSLGNAYFSLDHANNSNLKIIIRWIIFTFSTVHFYVIFKSSKN